MDLEEGECVEEEFSSQIRHQKNHDHVNIVHGNSSTLKRRREETVSTELGSEPGVSKESKSAEQEAEDEAELRRQLINQVLKKKSRRLPVDEKLCEQQNENQGSENVDATFKANDLDQMRAKFCHLNEQLREAQLCQSAIVMRKSGLQKSLAECEADLTHSQIKISSIMETILGLWSEAANAGLKTTDKGNSPIIDLVQRRWPKQQERSTEDIVEKRHHEKATTEKSTTRDTQQEKETDEDKASRKRQERSTEDTVGKRHHEKATTEKSTTRETQQEKETDEDKASRKRQERSATEDIVGKRHHEKATTEKSTTRETQQEKETDEDKASRKENQEAATTHITTANKSKEVAAEVSLPRLINENDNVDGFLASIRAYRLSPRFSHRLLAHQSISNRLDPFVPLCPFQLHGRCVDSNCPWQHENEYRMSEVDIVSEVIALWPSVCPQGVPPAQYATSLLASDRLEVVIGFLLSIMPEEAFNIKLNALSGIPRLATKPIPAEESIEFVNLLSTKQAFKRSSPIC